MSHSSHGGGHEMHHDGAHEMHHGGGHDMHHGSGPIPKDNLHLLQGPADHSTHADHVMSHMMSMTFHGGYNETILFEKWNIHSSGGLIGSFIAIFLMALLYEGLKYYRKHLLWKTYAGLQYCAVAPPDKNVSSDDPHIIQPVGHMVERKTPTMLSVPHVWQTALHGVQVFVSYMLMLVFMTYNVWLCVAVVLGSAVGYFLFGWRESVVVDFTEHCH